MQTVNIAVVPGDGIGKEVCTATVAVLQAATDGIADLKFEWFAGGAECYQSVGAAFPEKTRAACLKADAVLHGAVGLPAVVYKDGTEIGQDFSMQARQLMDLYANVRPVQKFEGIPTALSHDAPIDYVIVRENTEGLYAAHGGGNIIRDTVATDTLVMTRQGIERITRKAAELCMSSAGAPADGKRRVTIVDKANVLRSYAFFRKVAQETLEAYPEIEVEVQMVDAMTAHMLQRPDTFNVVVTENIFGDIISDLGAATVGGLGIAASAELGDRHGYFQGIHGSAPDIAGKSISNPFATMLSGAMMLEWLALQPEHRKLGRIGKGIRDAIKLAVQEGDRLTADIGGTATTEEAAQAVVDRVSGSNKYDR